MEALITRRGGSVKRGRISTVGDYSYARYTSITDPNLVNVRNAIIFLNYTGGYGGLPNSPKAVASVVIENGELVKGTAIVTINSQREVSSDYTSFFTFYPLEGKIKVSGNGGFLASDSVPAYDYIIFD